ncbi:MAG TPA: Txe/YoeB family addiction module toxin [Candidatus Kapabacteria bacterium]|nr:Txe/YoeB family addiction module toxin [Candidatus Kapabacteria bacterium]
MKVIFEGRAFRELREWAETDPKTVKKIFRLIDDIDRDPFHGLGFPEPLKHELAGFWSRQINEKDRLVYGVHSGVIQVASCKTHYA